MTASTSVPRYDVVVIGGGNAALCAALEARRAGRSVLILEAAPIDMRGGNSRHTRNIRYMHRAEDYHLVGAYTEDEFYEDLFQVTGGNTDEDLARLTIRSSEGLGQWMSGNGIRWQGALRGTLSLSRTNAFFLGGGKALLNTYYQAARALGIETAFDAEVTGLELRPEGYHQVAVGHAPDRRVVEAKTIVAAAGGFEANLDWLGEYWGEAAQNFIIRGTPYNNGGLLRLLLDAGAKAIGDPREYHAVACDARGPQFDGGIVTRLDSVPFGIVVNRDAQRFSDEGIDFWPKRYASWGGLIAREPDQIAFSILDSKMTEAFMPSLYPPVQAGSLRELAQLLGLDAEAFERTVAEFNGTVVSGTYDATVLDDCRTEGIEPAKSHWARTIAQPPFFAYPLRPGITFTYHGVGVDERAQVLRDDGQPLGNVFAAGEIMAGNILGRGYLAGFGMTIGTVFGRIAGTEAAKHAS
ncbi:MAG: FAD-dependent tricarballylate dehydrogenase TcuA [Dehalococcoidia bacterium]